MSILNKYKYAKTYKNLILACYLFNMFTFAIKLVYTAQLPAVIDDFHTTKAQASLGLTIYYFVYAVAQIVLSFFVLKLNMKNYILITSVLSAVSFSIIGFTNSLTVVWIIFGINGVLQAGCWGGVVYLLSKYLPNESLSHANKILATSSTVGNALTYAVSALFVEFLNWKITFIFFGVLFLFSIVYLFYQIIACDKILKKNDEISIEFVDNKKSTYVLPSGIKFNTSLFMTFIIVTSILANCLIYGLGNWIPNLLKDVHGFPTSLSILLTMVMPLIGMIASLSMMNSFDRTQKIFSKISLMTFISLILIVVMVFGYAWNFIFAIIMCVLLKYIPTCASAGSGSYVILKIKHYINAGTSTLIVNSGAAFAAGAMPFITGWIMDNFGWQQYYVFMAVIALLMFVLVFVGNIVIKRRDNIAKWM